MYICRVGEANFHDNQHETLFFHQLKLFLFQSNSIHSKQLARIESKYYVYLLAHTTITAMYICIHIFRASFSGDFRPRPLYHIYMYHMYMYIT